MARAFEVRERGLRRGQPGEACVMVIFGAAGDLARGDLVPSLYELHRKGLLPERFAAVGFSRSRWDSARYRDEMCAAVRESCGGAGEWGEFARRLSFVPGDATSPEGYAALARGIADARAAFGIPDNVFFHLAVPPALFPEIVRGLAGSGLARCDTGWRRLVVEKPFGHDRTSARELDRQLREVFREEAIYRVDHFLGKETVQNMLVFRFANPSFEPVWNRNYIDHVQITVAEDIGIGTRANFYEQTGIVRDMVQNHLLHLLCLAAIEPPVRFDAASLRNETAKVLDAVVAGEVDGGARAVLGQYGPGMVAGKEAAGYRGEQGVAPGSTTPTYAALRLTIDNWRWADVPFYLRTGKRLPRKLTEVAIEFKPTPHAMFGAQQGRRHRKVLVFQLQPDEGIVQDIAAKQPGPDLTVQPVRMTFRYAEAFGVEQPPRAYAWLLLDVMQGDQTLFAREDWIDKAWGIVDPIVEHRLAQPPPFPNYAAGTPGPREADALLARDGRRWREL
ncbi:MAG: glucose-6-phosphate 1-dehydrogenase [Acidobacteria bacterium]|nr:glucose-6-phosphate 1-dehydrogenase [Acidobacteriota bacterium]